MITQKMIDGYCKQVRKALKRNGIPDTRLLSDQLKNNLEEYLEDHPETSKQDIINSFGKPEEYVLEYAATLDSSEIKLNKINTTSMLRLRFAFVVALLMIIGSLAIWIGVKNDKTTVEYYDEIIIDHSIAETQDG